MIEENSGSLRRRAIQPGTPDIVRYLFARLSKAQAKKLLMIEVTPTRVTVEPSLRVMIVLPPLDCAEARVLVSAVPVSRMLSPWA